MLGLLVCATSWFLIAHSEQWSGVPPSAGQLPSHLTYVSPQEPAIKYSPYNWDFSKFASTINSGAYFRTLFSGNLCSLGFDVSQMVTPASQIVYRIDNGPFTKVNVASSVSLVIPPVTVNNSDIKFHLLEVIVKSTTERANRWIVGQPSTRVIFTGFILNQGSQMLPVSITGPNILIYGDSITEGVRTLGEFTPNDTDFNDATMGYAFALRGLLGAEVGVVGFGATGLSRGGSGNVPPSGKTWDLLFEGAQREFEPSPDLIVTNLGTNDGTVDIVEPMVDLLNNLLKTCSSSRLAVLRPFNGAQAANLQKAIASCSRPTSVHYIDTTGFFDPQIGADTLNLHPSGPNGVARIAPAVAAKLIPLLFS